MKKYKINILIFFGLLLLISMIILITENNRDDIENAKKIKTSLFVRTEKKVIPEMLCSDYWLDKQKNPNNIIMTPLEIDIWNQEFTNLSKGSEISFGHFMEVRQVVLGEKVYNQIIGMFEQPKEVMYDENGEELDDDFWQQLFLNRNLDGIVNEQEIKYAYTVNRVDIRALPYEGIITNQKGNNYFCQLQVSSILMNEPVIVLHESMDGKWYFIITRYCAGWIRKENVGICNDFFTWLEAMNPDNFLVVTGNKEILDVDTEHIQASDLVLYMGTKLELIECEQYEAEQNGRVPFECYIVRIPARDISGMLVYDYAFIPVSRDVHVGYMEYTIENLVALMFKVNGDRYGWGGMYNARDCSQYIMEIYKVFGFDFARNSAAQASMPFEGYDLKGLNDEEKKAILKSVPIGSILYFSGHVMLYLGEDNGEYYVISETARIMQEDVIINAHSCMITSLSVKRPSGKTWLSELSMIRCVK